MQMSERTLIVTGGTGGLGSAVVPRLLREYRCVILFHSEEGLEALKRTAGATERLHGIHADLTDEASVRAAIAHAVNQWGALYGVVHLAGGFATGLVSATSTETWQRMIGLNLTSAFIVVREALAAMKPTMKSAGPGRIIAISSEATLTKSPESAAYTISKSALNRLIELTAAELKGTSITANALLPSALDTPATRKQMPSARLVSLDRAAETIAFLLSDAAAHITGALIPLRG